MMSEQIKPFTLAVPDAVLEDLRLRLAHTRWPEPEPVSDWSQGAPLNRVKALCDYWAKGYDWRRCEAKLNQAGQFQTNLDGLDIHFLHIRSPEPNAMPLLLTHGWPGSIIEFFESIGPLSNPRAYGGDAADAFHLVIPSLPGYGFSGKPTEPGWSVQRIAAAWAKLMDRLGYEHYVAQGGDWGAAVTTALGVLRPPGLDGIHLNMPLIFPEPGDIADATPEEAKALARMKFYQDFDSGYAKQQGTRPQTLGYGLTDSPAGQAAWIYEKFYAWTDNAGAPEDALSQDQMLDNIMFYWLPAAATSSARLYWESIDSFVTCKLDLPVGVSLYPKEIFHCSRRWADRAYSNIIHWNELPKGGHFAAFEQPESFVNELRTCFRTLR